MILVHAYVSENPSPRLCAPFVLSVYTGYMKVCLEWGRGCGRGIEVKDQSTLCGIFIAII